MFTCKIIWRTTSEKYNNTEVFLSQQLNCGQARVNPRLTLQKSGAVNTNEVVNTL